MRRLKFLKVDNLYYLLLVLHVSMIMEKVKNSNVLPVVLAGLWFKLDWII